MSRTDKFMARARAHLLTLPDAEARLAFIAEQIDKWEGLYARFQYLAARDQLDAAPSAPTAFDYVETIAALGKLAARHDRVPA